MFDLVMTFKDGVKTRVSCGDMKRVTDILEMHKWERFKIKGRRITEGAFSALDDARQT